MSVKITQRYEWDAGHRLLRHNGKCRNVHGHRYVAEATYSGPLSNEDGMIVDFGELKAVVQGWLDHYWDHGMLLEIGDRLVRVLEEEKAKLQVLYRAPTAENLVDELAETIRILLRSASPHVTLVRLRLWETPKCSAEWLP